ncbi:hypothetical protein T492DRAFT_1118350 [Pavlovales sp. CCMP2436]|nr:hypothetical protein T492DRAFT_1118350 [Pavlovales sp. CCMP2436]
MFAKRGRTSALARGYASASLPTACFEEEEEDDDKEEEFLFLLQGRIAIAIAIIRRLSLCSRVFCHLRDARVLADEAAAAAAVKRGRVVLARVLGGLRRNVDMEQATREAAADVVGKRLARSRALTAWSAWAERSRLDRSVEHYRNSLWAKDSIVYSLFVTIIASVVMIALTVEHYRNSLWAEVCRFSTRGPAAVCSSPPTEQFAFGHKANADRARYHDSPALLHLSSEGFDAPAPTSSSFASEASELPLTNGQTLLTVDVADGLAHAALLALHSQLGL